MATLTGESVLASLGWHGDLREDEGGCKESILEQGGWAVGRQWVSRAGPGFSTHPYMDITQNHIFFSFKKLIFQLCFNPLSQKEARYTCTCAWTQKYTHSLAHKRKSISPVEPEHCPVLKFVSHTVLH